MPHGVAVDRVAREAFWALVRAGVHPDLAAARAGVSAAATTV